MSVLPRVVPCARGRGRCRYSVRPVLQLPVLDRLDRSFVAARREAAAMGPRYDREVPTGASAPEGSVRSPRAA